MCGIVGYVGKREVVGVLLQGLKCLEYRGYDSAGVAFQRGSFIQVEKAEGRLENVKKLLQSQSFADISLHCGIGHTRWATHGKPSVKNAHPHRVSHVVLVHNGIIENYLEIKKELLLSGHHPESETDSELFGFLVWEAMEGGLSLENAVRHSFLRLRGHCSVLVMSEREPGVIVGVRNGPPLVAAFDPEGGVMLASDPQPLLVMGHEVLFLENEDVIVVRDGALRVCHMTTGLPLARKKTWIEGVDAASDSGVFAHFMLKEMHEQPRVCLEILDQMVERSDEGYQFLSHPAIDVLAKAQELCLVACGSAWHAALLGKYWIERWARLPVSVELASEFRYRSPVLRPGTLVVGVSQSGETADTLAVIKAVKAQGIPTLGLCNVRESLIAQEVEAFLPIFAGPEIGVAATKTFFAQAFMLAVIAACLGMKKGEKLDFLWESFFKLPDLLSKQLELQWQDGTSCLLASQVRAVIQRFSDAQGFFFIGRGYCYPLALEGALKLKELAYDHAEGYAAGELKHGPIAMIEKGMVVVVLACQDSWRDKTISNLEEVKARGATIVGIGDPCDQELQSLCDHWISVLQEEVFLHAELYSLLLIPPIQFFSYFRALWKGTDVDHPRNLAKSVTVE
jgi:glucosamine--fructose-6-phosphate aminotransferase (isomerizing)